MKKKGFTLIELTVVVAVIAILAGGIFVAIDPARRLHESRNARRSTDITTILDALKAFQADNSGSLYTNVADLPVNVQYQIGTANGGCEIPCGVGNEDTNGNCVDLTGIGTNYLAVIPYDPTAGSAATSHYAVSKDSNGAVAVQACDAEGEGAGGNGVAPILRVTR